MRIVMGEMFDRLGDDWPEPSIGVDVTAQEVAR